jgi:hypothetical protein
MTLETRIPLYAEIEARRKRPLIAYITSSRHGAPGLMASDCIPEILDQLSTIGPDNRSADLLIASYGGDPTVAWRIMSLMRERFAEVSVLVPQAAFSAATLLSLGADQIVMHPNANLGPVDPQFTSPKPNGGPQDLIRYGYEELAGFFDFARMQQITDQEQLRGLFGDLVKEVGAIGLGIAARGSKLLLSMGEQLLRMHMRGEGDAERAKEIAEKLNRNFAHHGYPLSRQEAKEMGLKVAQSDPELEKKIWNVWRDVEDELKIREPFNVVNELERSPAGQVLFGPMLQIQIPAGAPPAMAIQAYQNILGQIQTVQIDPVKYTVAHAIVESSRAASRNETEGRILAMRLPDGQLQMNIVTVRSGWKSQQIPAPANAQPVAAP